jgi:polyferredoxin
VLVAIKLLHTVAWAFFVACILALPVAGALRRFDLALVLTVLVLFETAVLVFNGWACPFTAIAARYTDDRRDNFDIYLPEWLARHNKRIFGTLFILGLLFVLYRRFE